MKKLITVIVIVGSVVMLASSAFAGGMSDAMWRRQQSGVQGVLHCFVSGVSLTQYDRHATDIVSAEINLMAFGASPTNARFVSRLAKDLKFPADYPVFAWRLLKEKLAAEAGVTIGAGQSLQGRNIEVESTDQRFPGSLTVSY